MNRQKDTQIPHRHEQRSALKYLHDTLKTITDHIHHSEDSARLADEYEASYQKALRSPS